MARVVVTPLPKKTGKKASAKDRKMRGEACGLLLLSDHPTGQQVHKVVKATGNAVCVDQIPLGVPIDIHPLFKYSIE
jgi:hypothetical protein